MPPRKRTAPTSEPEQEPLKTPAEDAQEEPPAGDETTDGTPAESTPAKHDRQEAEQPCTECFRDGWPGDATSIGCSHGTWNRDL